MTKTPPKQHSKKIKMVYQSPPQGSNRKRLPSNTPAQVPVFMLPQDDMMSTIPEVAELRQGFFLNMTLQPHETRVFSGLMSLSEPDELAMEQSSTTAVEFRSYECIKTIDKALAILSRSREFPDPITIARERNTCIPPPPPLSNSSNQKRFSVQ